MIRSVTAPLAAICLLFTAAFQIPASAKAQTLYPYSVQVSDPQNQLGSHKSAFLKNFAGAIEQWNRALIMKGSLRVTIEVTTSVTGIEGASATNIFIGYLAGIPVYEESAAYAIRTGVNVSPGSPDLKIKVNPNFLRTEAWFDPKPMLRTQAVPTNKTDLVSLLTHELGHAFGMNGFADQNTDQPNPLYLSVFDTFLSADSNGPTFVGPNTFRAYGDALPLTPHNLYHYGTLQTPELDYGLMNGIVFFRGTRYYVSTLEVSIMKDLGQTAR
jgi:hypothetical protein